MTTPDSKFIWIANDPALDLINTTPVIDGRPTDLLASPDDLLDWLLARELIDRPARAALADRFARDAAAGRRALEDAREFREHLRALAEAAVAGREPPPRALDALNARLAQGPPVSAPRVARRGGKFVRETAAPPPAPDERTLMLPVAHAAADLLTLRDPALLRRCENPACVLFFYDTSKNHARRWCSMDQCGNRHKVAAHYRRTRKAAAQGRTPRQS